MSEPAIQGFWAKQDLYARGWTPHLIYAIKLAPDDKLFDGCNNVNLYRISRILDIERTPAFHLAKARADVRGAGKRLDEAVAALESALCHAKICQSYATSVEKSLVSAGEEKAKLEHKLRWLEDHFEVGIDRANQRAEALLYQARALGK